MVFAAALVAGFVFAHEPQRETVSITVRETPFEPRRSHAVSGVIGSLRDGSIVLVGDDQSTEIEIPSAAPLDELTYLPADGAPFAVGTVVNLGTADTETGFIITGLVAVEPAAP